MLVINKDISDTVGVKKMVLKVTSYVDHPCLRCSFLEKVFLTKFF